MGVEKEDQILRAQGALFILMFQNETLKNALLSEYENNKQNLPFTLQVN